MTQFWAGTQKAYDDFQSIFINNAHLIKAAHEGTLARRGSSDDPEDLDYWGEAPEKIQVVNGVGIISFKGSMVRHETWLTRLCQIPTYAGIKSAITEVAGGLDGARIVMLNGDTPGGLVDGCGGLGRFIAEVDKKVMPIYGYTGGELCSAGYWLFSNTRRIYADHDTHVGSIGVLAIHQEISRMLEEAGIKVSVFRSAPFKCLSNRYEPLTKAAKDEIDEEMSAQHNKFVEVIADGRRLEKTYVSKNIASGRVFSEEKAQSLGMIDAVGSIEVIVSKLAEQAAKMKPVGTPAQPAIKATNEAAMTTKKRAVALPQDQLAALAMGAIIPTDALPAKPAVAAAAETVEEDETPEPDAAAIAAAAATAAAATAAAAAPVVAAAAATPAAVTIDPVVTMLQGQLSESNGKVTSLTVELTAVTAARDAALASNASYEPVIRDCISRLAIAVNATVPGLDTMTGAQLVGQFQSLNATFQQRFATARVTSANSEAVSAPSAGNAGQTVTPIHRAGLRATGLK